MSMQKKKALFLDRDGVVNEDFHYAHKPEHIRFRKGIFELCRAALKRGYVLIVVTNQAGVARGKFTEEDVRALHSWMKGVFEKQGIEITAFYYCPYHAGAALEQYRMESDMRKPKPGMFLQAAREHNLDLASSLMVGDKESDRIELPELKTVVVKSEYTETGWDVETLEEVKRLL